jgi:hypothetical protein
MLINGNLLLDLPPLLVKEFLLRAASLQVEESRACGVSGCRCTGWCKGWVAFWLCYGFFAQTFVRCNRLTSRWWLVGSSCGRRSVDQFVLVSGSPLGPMTRFYLFPSFDNYFVVLPVMRPLWREDGSVNCSTIGVCIHLSILQLTVVFRFAGCSTFARKLVSGRSQIWIKGLKVWY